MRNVHCGSDAYIIIPRLNLFQCSQIWCCFHEYGAALLTPHPQPPAPVAPRPHPHPAPCWVSPGWGSADGRAPLWGPRLWQLVKGPRGSARLSQQPLSDAQPSPSLQNLWCRQYAHAHIHPHTHTFTCTHGQCIPSRALRSPSQPVGQTSAAGEVKTPSRIKEEEQQEDGGREG